ncbi:three component ABC system middle component [Kitasatospora purpeofusca]|uniref:three component ABC system middle component n=1 Tax=Kitasatospora purpeofusca TaxID=67352 RepID=UPI003869748F
MPARQPRLPEVEALLNPAFGAYVLAHGAAAYSTATSDQAALPWPSAFLVLPLVLPPDSRAKLPRDTRTTLAAWLGDHPVERAVYPRRAAGLHEHARASIRFGIRHRILVLTPTGLAAVGRPRRPAPAEDGEEAASCVRAAVLMGRWLAASDPATAFTLLGVRP